ncbi:glycoside hydrolase family 172 protein [Aeoliella sp.]|uniref:glycoside hydrolase family 172 protein n=1 Tax=Aeoliella sp. TaxID=2795800 RepID=UPI003CCC16D2
MPRVLALLLAILSPCCATIPADGQSIGDLSDLAKVSNRTSHRASSFDRSGANTDNVTALAPGAVHQMLDTNGPGKITHIWMTVSSYAGTEAMLRDLVIRMYWENSVVPSVEVPLGDFFGLGHGKQYKVRSLPINVGSNTTALNCYWPMPFYKHARVELVNTGDRSIRRIYYNVDYELGDVEPGQGLFHANYRRVRDLHSQSMAANTHGEDNYVILDTTGKGQYVGCFLYIDSAPGGWWGEGDEMIFIDGETKPSIVGTGTEDYFGNAWGFDGVANHLFYGVPLLERQPDGWTQTSVYRLHVPDPVRFSKRIRVTLEHSWPGNKTYDYSSVAYWYQTSPAAEREPLLSRSENAPRLHVDAKANPTVKPVNLCGTQFEPALRDAGVEVKAITTGHRDTFGGGLLQIASSGEWVELSLPDLPPATYDVEVKLHDQPGNVVARIDQGDATTPSGSAVGTVKITPERSGSLYLKSDAPFVLDVVRLKPRTAE